MKGIESIKENDGVLQRELAQCDDRLVEIDRQQERLLQLALKDFPEALVTQECERLNGDRIDLETRKAELQEKIKQVRQTQVSIEHIGKACQLVRENLGKLTLEDKRLALSAFGVRIELDKDNILITGSIPLGVVVTTPSKRNGARIPSISACQLRQPGQRLALG